MEPLPRLEDLGDLTNKNVLVRADFNVPIRGGQIVDDFRIRAALPTLRWLKEAGANITVCTHLGRPKGQVVPELTVEPLRRRLDELISGITLLENLRFDPREKTNDPKFADELTEGIDFYVNDAFGVSHRAHTSVVAVAERLPSAAGRCVEKEARVLSKIVAGAKRPFVAVLGGSKVSDKLGVIEALLPKVDRLLIGGGMCFTFLKAQGHSIGSSICEDEMVQTCAELLKDNPEKIVLPHDLVALGPGGVIGKPEIEAQVLMTPVNLDQGWMGLDIGPGTAAAMIEVIEEAGTVFWNGPMGVFEDPRFEAGTKALAQAIAQSRAFSVIGGGDSASAVAKFSLTANIDHISTGGGASLKLIETGDLVGFDALRQGEKNVAHTDH